MRRASVWWVVGGVGLAVLGVCFYVGVSAGGERVPAPSAPVFVSPLAAASPEPTGGALVVPDACVVVLRHAVASGVRTLVEGEPVPFECASMSRGDVLLEVASLVGDACWADVLAGPGRDGCAGVSAREVRLLEVEAARELRRG